MPTTFYISDLKLEPPIPLHLVVRRLNEALVSSAPMDLRDGEFDEIQNKIRFRHPATIHPGRKREFNASFDRFAKKILHDLEVAQRPQFWIDPDIADRLAYVDFLNTGLAEQGKHLPNGEFVLVDGAIEFNHHSPYADDPKQLNHILVTFFKNRSEQFQE